MRRLAYSEIILMGICALLLFFISCDSEAEKERVRIERETEVAREDSSLMIKDERLIKKTELRREIDSLRKIMKRKLSNYDSVGVDSLGRTIYMHKNDSRSLK